MLCDGDQLVDVLKNGQGVLNVLSLGGVREELEADLAPMAIEHASTLDRPLPSNRMTLQRSPLDAEHRALGATMVEFGGWEMPIAYPSGTIEEHLACRRRAVMFDVSHLGTVRVEGPDAFERLQSTLTNDLAKIEPGRAQYTHLLDAVRCLGGRRHHRVVAPRRSRGVRRDAERLEHRRCPLGDRWHRHHRRARRRGSPRT